MKCIYFWQLTISPHMVYLANELSKNGYQVNVIARESLSQERKEMGWATKELNGVNILILDRVSNYEKILKNVNSEAIHIVQGIRGNGYITELMKKFRKNKSRFWIIMETVNEIGFLGFIKKIEYARLFFRYKKNINGVLAIGYNTPNWLKSVGANPKKIYPFSYFLEPSSVEDNDSLNERFKFIFVGRMVDIKRPNLLVEACARIEGKENLSIQFIGEGDLKEKIKSLAMQYNLNTEFLGNIAIDEVRKYLAQADCLILPSLHDGWGAVTTESMIEGTPVICSDACGSAQTVINSNFGGVFAFNDIPKFNMLVENQFKRGGISPDERKSLKKWAICLNSHTGADYLDRIISGKNLVEKAPWE